MEEDEEVCKRLAEKACVADFTVSDSVGYITYTKGGKLFVTALLIATIVLLIYGGTVSSFRFTFQGVIAVLLNWNSSDVQSFSLVSIVTSLSAQAGSSISSQLGILLLQFTFLTVSLGVPIARTMVMLVLWLVPLSVHHQHNLQEASEFFHSWSSLEVFLISLIAGLFEVNTMASFMLGNRCDTINKYLQDFAVASHVIPSEQGTCFSVATELSSNIVFLLLASAIGTIAGRIVTDATRRVLDERQRYAIEIEDNVGNGGKNFAYMFLKCTGMLMVSERNPEATTFQKTRRRTFTQETKSRRSRVRSAAALDQCDSTLIEYWENYKRRAESIPQTNKSTLMPKKAINKNNVGIRSPIIDENEDIEDTNEV